jgi:hypothetical protein
MPSTNVPHQIKVFCADTWTKIRVIKKRGKIFLIIIQVVSLKIMKRKRLIRNLDYCSFEGGLF